MPIFDTLLEVDQEFLPSSGRDSERPLMVVASRSGQAASRDLCHGRTSGEQETSNE